MLSLGVSKGITWKLVLWSLICEGFKGSRTGIYHEYELNSRKVSKIFYNWAMEEKKISE